MRNLGYFIKEAFVGFKRNLGTTIGSIITIFLSLLIIGTFILFGFIVNGIIESIESEVTITAYLSDDATDKEVAAFEKAVKKLSGVSNVTYTSKDEALEKFKTSMSSNPEIIDVLEGNPLPASYGIELSDPEQVSAVAEQIAQMETYAKVAEDPADPASSLEYGQKTVDQLFSVVTTIRYVGIGLIVLLVFISFVFMNNTIRLAILARNREISIMRLVGASNGFIRGPFLAEGALHAIIGALLAAAVIEVTRRFVLPQLGTTFMWLPVNLGTSTFALVYVVLLVAGLVIGLLGSALAMRRYLKV